MSGRRPGRPALSLTAATAVLRQEWGLAGTLSALPSDSDQNFRVVVAEGPGCVLRISNSGQSESFLDATTALLAQLAGAELGTQRVIETVEGRRFTHVDHEGTRYLACATEWIEGRTLADHTDRDPSTLKSLGNFLARLDSAIEDYDHPALRRDLVWDLANGVRVIEERQVEAGTSQTLFDDDQEALFGPSFDDHLERYEPLLQLLSRAAVHNDPNDHNVLLSADADSPIVVGILDFGDAVHSYRIADLAIGSAYAMLGSRTPLLVVANVVRGYAALRPLSDLERHLLLPLIRLRLMVSVTMSAHMSRVEPDNPYLSVSERDAWIALQQLSSMDFDRAERVIMDRSVAASVPVTIAPAPAAGTLREQRGRLLSPSFSLSYDEPLIVVRGWMQHLFDTDGRAYLDCVNNICHVGHSHPRVVAALSKQAALLNTNSRYLHPLRVEYARRLLATLPSELDTCFFVSSGTEANELAWRIALAATGRTQAVVLEGAYHGNATATLALSPYKFNGPGGSGRPAHVHVAPLPDTFRGACRDPHAAADFYLDGVGQALARAEEQGGAAAFFMESIPSCGGQIIPPTGYVRGAFERAHKAGAVVVADEVQTGFGRVGSAFWAFAAEGAQPDIVTMGKPMGNGHPLGAVVVKRELANAFANGMEYFASFGGNPVSCAAGLAVLDVIRDEQLQKRAQVVGGYLLAQLRDLAADDPRIGEVRGRGLFVGVEFVVPGPSRMPDAHLAHEIVQKARHAGVLLSTDGPDHNVIKVKPPLVFSEVDADRLVGELARALSSS